MSVERTSVPLDEIDPFAETLQSIYVPKVVAADPRGACGGVNAANKRLNEIFNRMAELKAAGEMDEEEVLYIFNPPVHNESVLRRFQERGLLLITGIDKNIWLWDLVPDGKPVAFPAHGAKPQDWETALAKGCIIFDLSCKLVDNEHRLIRQAIEESRHAMYFAKKDHPEPRGVMGEVPSESITFIYTEEDIYQAFETLPSDQIVEFFNQTTMSTKEIAKYKKIAKELFGDRIFMNLRRLGCYATDNRQEAFETAINEAIQEALSKGRDSKAVVAITVGSTISNNGTNLKKIGTELGVQSIMVNDASEIDSEMFSSNSGVEIVVISSAASTDIREFNGVVNRFAAGGSEIIYQVPTKKENPDLTFKLERADVSQLDDRYKGRSNSQTAEKVIGYNT